MTDFRRTAEDIVYSGPEGQREAIKVIEAALRTVAEETAARVRQRCAEVAERVHAEASLYPCSEDSAVGCSVAQQIKDAIEAMDLGESR